MISSQKSRGVTRGRSSLAWHLAPAPERGRRGQTPAHVEIHTSTSDIRPFLRRQPEPSDERWQRAYMLPLSPSPFPVMTNMPHTLTSLARSRAVKLAASRRRTRSLKGWNHPGEGPAVSPSWA